MPFFRVLVKVELDVHADSLGMAVKRVEGMENLRLVTIQGEDIGAEIKKADIYGVNAQHTFPN